MATIDILLRESFEQYSPGETGSWKEQIAAGDLIYLDGNALAASYLVISKDPLTAGTETSIETTAVFEIPVEVSVGAHMSQRTVGQDFFIETVDVESIAPIADKPILSIQQAASVLTINFAEPHDLVVGKRIGVSGVSDSRLNYPSLVVATTPSPTQLTCTTGPAGTIPSVTAGPFANGTVYVRPGLGYARNGASMVFEQASTTQASMYCRSDSGDLLPSGTAAGAHSITIGSTASVVLANAANTYAFTPTTEYRCVLKENRLQWSDTIVDGVAGFINRQARTQVLPSYKAVYKSRIRACNNKGRSVPVAQIVSVSKTGTTTATIIFDRPHGLTVADQIVTYGVRDQANFANLVAATAIASIVNPTTITCVWGAAVTATSYGGYVARVNGGNLMSALGGIAQVIQSAALSTVAGRRILTLVGNTTWAGLLIGDGCNAVGVRNAVNGASLGVDGAWRVQNLSTSTLVLEQLDPNQVLPADFGVTNCGGAIIKRTELRLSWFRISRCERDVVETQVAPITDAYAATEVQVVNSLSATITEGTLVTPGISAVVTAASTNGTSVKTTAGTVYDLTVSNTSAAAVYYKIYNKASAPTVGTDVPVITVPVPANTMLSIEFGRVGKRLTLGVAIAVTGAMAATDTTAVAAGVQTTLSYI